MPNSMIPQYDTKLMTQVWESAEDFVAEYADNGIPTTISNENAALTYYLMYARYGNNPIANLDENQFKYKVWSVIFQYGPTWEKKLALQSDLRTMTLQNMLKDGGSTELGNASGSKTITETGTNGNTRTLNTTTANTGSSTLSHTGTITDVGSMGSTVSSDALDVANHAFNPGTTPSADAFTPLGYINEQNAKKTGGTVMTIGSDGKTTTYGNTDTTTNNLSKKDTGTITDAGTVGSTATSTDSSNTSLTRSNTKGILNAYAELIELLEADVSGDYISKFKKCFKQFVMPEKPLLYVSEEEE